MNSTNSKMMNSTLPLFLVFLAGRCLVRGRWVASFLVVATSGICGNSLVDSPLHAEDLVKSGTVLAMRDGVAELQAAAAETNVCSWGHWGATVGKYSSWTNHSNRLVPVYVFGGNLNSVKGENSVYRSPEKLERVYGFLPTKTVNPKAEYFDQTDVYRLQQEAIAAGKKRVVLMVFDGMDWQTTHAASIVKNNAVLYTEGRGKGLAFLDYQTPETDIGFMVTSPHNTGTSFNVDSQIVRTPGGNLAGGYDSHRGGEFPWSVPSDLLYPIGAGEGEKHAFTDSAASATSMTSGIKTYNDAINVDYTGREVVPLARELQELGFSVGVVSSVPVSHATPACAYANNVERNDYQDLTRDLIGRPSVFHPGGLPGVDVLLGGGWGEERDKDGSQGENFVPGNRYLPADDLAAIDVENGGKYRIAQRTPGIDGGDLLKQATAKAVSNGERLLGYFGVAGGHLPYRTANGDYRPVASVGNPETAKPEVYSQSDIEENVTLAEMSLAALEVLESRQKPWWLMVEAGDVDWANHANNIDNSIGAVISGEEAFIAITGWIESHGGWDDTLLILTADHGHYLFLDNPQALCSPE